MSDQFYAVRYQLMPSNIHMLAIFSLEERAKAYAIHLLENENGGHNNPFLFEAGNFVAAIPANPSDLPHYYEDVTLQYVNNVIPKAY